MSGSGGFDRLLGGDEEAKTPPAPRTDDEWIAYVALQREQAIRMLRWCDDILVRRGKLKVYTLPRRTR